MFNDRQKRFLESKLCDILREEPEITFIELLEGRIYKAYFLHDGTDNKENEGTVTFKCHLFPEMFEDFELIDLTGGKYFITSLEIDQWISDTEIKRK